MVFIDEIFVYDYEANYPFRRLNLFYFSFIFIFHEVKRKLISLSTFFIEILFLLCPILEINVEHIMSVVIYE